MSDFQQSLQHELQERRTNRVYLVALFVGIAVVVAALISGLGI